MVLHEAQKQIARSLSRFRVINAGRRFGKTVLAVEEMKGLALARESKIAYIAPTYGQARDICWEILKREMLPITKKVNESRLELEVMTKEGKSSFISLRGWESVETMRGQSYDLLILDEVASMRNFLTGWNEVLSPTLVDRKGQAMFISTPKGFNHFYDLFNMPDKDKNYESFHFTTYDNPNIPVEEIEREKLSKPENTFAQEYLADFRKQEGLVYKEFDRALHVYDGEPTRAITEHLAGVDFGFTNPCAVIPGEFDSDGHYWIPSEWYKKERTEEQIAEYIKGCAFNDVYPDPENPSAIEVLNRKGVNVQEVVKGKGSVQSGINAVRNLFKQNRIHIHKDCVNLIWELETYAYKEKKPDSNEPEEPIKENDHALDALRYMIMTHQGPSGMSEIEKYMMTQARMHQGINYRR